MYCEILMMNLHAGTFLKSSSTLDDPNFQQALVLITEHNANGSTGFVVNKLFPRTLNELTAFSHVIEFPLYKGGPVDPEHLYFIHRRPDLIGGGMLIANNLYFGGDFNYAVRCINNRMIKIDDIKIFIGYCGWDNEELEEEIAEGSWQIIDNDTKTVFAS